MCRSVGKVFQRDEKENGYTESGIPSVRPKPGQSLSRLLSVVFHGLGGKVCGREDIHSAVFHFEGETSIGLGRACD